MTQEDEYTTLDPTPSWRGYISWLAWEHLGLSLEKLEEVRALLRVLSPRPWLSGMDRFSYNISRKRPSFRIALWG